MASDMERLVPLTTEGEGSPLFCVHAGSGSAYSYAELARLLGPGQPVYAFEAPGFDGVREPVRSLIALSAEYAQILREFQPDGGYRLLGWSIGGVIAFNMAQQLTAAGVAVSQIILVDTSLPWIADLPPELEIQRRFLRDLTGVADAGSDELEAVLSLQPEDADEAVTFAAIEKAGVLPEELDADVLQERYKVFRAHIEALFAYEVTGPTYHGPVLHLVSADAPPRYMRWDTVADNVTDHIIPGDHQSIWKGDSLLAMSELIRPVLGSPS